ncbi:MAG: DUF3592 domain-containing protein [Hyphomicrobium sp.]|nr:hypothetical protein [Hyphomicrobium sp.]
MSLPSGPVQDNDPRADALGSLAFGGAIVFALLIFLFGTVNKLTSRQWLERNGQDAIASVSDFRVVDTAATDPEYFLVLNWRDDKRNIAYSSAEKVNQDYWAALKKRPADQANIPIKYHVTVVGQPPQVLVLPDAPAQRRSNWWFIGWVMFALVGLLGGLSVSWSEFQRLQKEEQPAQPPSDGSRQ